MSYFSGLNRREAEIRSQVSYGLVLTFSLMGSLNVDADSQVDSIRVEDTETVQAEALGCKTGSDACGQAELRDKAGVPGEASAKEGSGVFRDCPQCPEMVIIPAGTFMMGSLPSEIGYFKDQGPLHEVTIRQAFAAGKYEVTFEEWDACKFSGGCRHRPRNERTPRTNYPVDEVNWIQIQEYVSWLSAITGKHYRLLSEAEWEYAARAGSTTSYSWGVEIDCGMARYGRYKDECSVTGPAPVGSYPPNAFGLHDMHGNVSEWVQDCWHYTYGNSPNDGRPWLSGYCDVRVLRGGSWLSSSLSLRSAARNSAFMEPRFAFGHGFRVAREL